MTPVPDAPSVTIDLSSIAYEVRHNSGSGTKDIRIQGASGVTASDGSAVTVSVSVDGGAAIDATSSTSLRIVTDAAEGTYSMVVTATAGDATATKTDSVFVDKTGPAFSPDPTAEQDLLDLRKVTVEFAATDLYGPVTYSVKYSDVTDPLAIVHVVEPNATSPLVLNLEYAKQYTFEVTATDANSNATVYAIPGDPIDTGAAPSGLTFGTVSMGTVTHDTATVEWSGFSDEVPGAIEKYVIGLYAADESFITSHETPQTSSGSGSHQFTALDASTDYKVKVTVFDNSANSVTGGFVSFTTLVAPDTAAPTGGAVSVDFFNHKRATVSWSGFSDASGIAKYDLRVNGGAAVLDVSTPYELGGLDPETSYTVEVRATDSAAAANVGDWVAAAAFTTKALDATWWDDASKNVQIGKSEGGSIGYQFLDASEFSPALALPYAMLLKNDGTWEVRTEILANTNGYIVPAAGDAADTDAARFNAIDELIKANPGTTFLGYAYPEPVAPQTGGETLPAGVPEGSTEETVATSAEADALVGDGGLSAAGQDGMVLSTDPFAVGEYGKVFEFKTDWDGSGSPNTFISATDDPQGGGYQHTGVFASVQFYAQGAHAAIGTISLYHDAGASAAEDSTVIAHFGVGYRQLIIVKPGQATFEFYDAADGLIASYDRTATNITAATALYPAVQEFGSGIKLRAPVSVYSLAAPAETLPAGVPEGSTEEVLTAPAGTPDFSDPDATLSGDNALTTDQITIGEAGVAFFMKCYNTDLGVQKRPRIRTMEDNLSLMYQVDNGTIDVEGVSAGVRTIHTVSGPHPNPDYLSQDASAPTTYLMLIKPGLVEYSLTKADGTVTFSDTLVDASITSSYAFTPAIRFPFGNDMVVTDYGVYRLPAA